MINTPVCYMKRIVSFIFMVVLIFGESVAQVDTLLADYSDNKQIIQWNHDYHQTLTMKLFLSQAGYDGKFKRKDNGDNTVYLTFEKALEVIAKMDNLSLGVPKIIYLVGWQYNGHDSKYPAWFEVNSALKREKDETALASLLWLMEEAKKYHTTVSLHINMFDAYPDSPLWETYVANDIIAKNKDGSLREGEWGYPISYAQEMKTGYAQKRIDSLCALLPISEAGTIHIDAFHGWAPIGENGPGKRPFIKGPITPFLGYSVEEEAEAQKQIFKYWASKGVDVTSEGAVFLREDNFAGLQPMSWWVDWGLEDYMKWPASYYSGGTDSRDLGKIFGTSMHGEDIARNDSKNLNGFKKEFCNRTLVWYYLNQLDRKYFVINNKNKSIQFSDGVISTLKDEVLTIKKNERSLVEQEDIFVEALWMEDASVIAYSEKGYQDKQWDLPDAWSTYHSVEVLEVSITGKKLLGDISITDNKIELDLKPDQMVVLRAH